MSNVKAYIVQAWLVIALALCFGCALAGVEVAWGPRIEQNKRDETYAQIPRLVPGAQKDQTQEVEVAGRKVYRAMGAGRHLGWVIPAGGLGFADRIELLIGLDRSASTITGLYVLEQKETPGLGNNIVQPKWLGQFAGKKTAAPIAVTKSQTPGESEIQAVTGATISSQSVCRIVNETVAELRDQLAAQAAEAANAR